MNQLRARRGLCTVITAVLALAVATAMLPRGRLLHGVTRSQIWSRAHVTHAKRHEHTAFAAPAAQGLWRPALERTAVVQPRELAVAFRVPEPCSVRGPPLLS
jgi:hypothetical protein